MKLLFTIFFIFLPILAFCVKIEEFLYIFKFTGSYNGVGLKLRVGLAMGSGLANLLEVSMPEIQLSTLRTVPFVSN